MHENQLSCQETSIQFGLSGSVHYGNGSEDTWKKGKMDWKKKKGRNQDHQSQNLQRPGKKNCWRELNICEAENEYLKKLNALVAEREKREKENR